MVYSYKCQTVDIVPNIFNGIQPNHIYNFTIIGYQCGVEPYTLHGYGMHPCIQNGECFKRGCEIDLHAYAVDLRMILPVVMTRINTILESK